MALASCKTCERLMPFERLDATGKCRRCGRRERMLYAQAVKVQHARLGFKKYDARYKTGRYAKTAV